MPHKTPQTTPETYAAECRRLQREHDLACDRLTGGVVFSPDEVEAFFLRALRIGELMLRQHAPHAFLADERETAVQRRRAQFRVVP